MPASIIGSGCILLAVLITFSYAATTSFFTAPPLRGPDTMGYSMVYMILAARWLLVAVAMVCCLTQGKFTWISARPWLAALITLACHTGLGALSILAWSAWTGPRQWYTVPAGNLGSLALPLAACLYLAILLWCPPTTAAGRPLRLLASTLAVPGALGFLAGSYLFIAWRVSVFQHQVDRAREVDQAIEQNRLDDIAREQRQAAELAALPDDAPIDQFLPHLFIDKSEAHHAAALARIRALPNLTDRLAQSLAVPDPRQREYASNFIRMCPDPPDPAWLPAVRSSLSMLAADITAAPALYDQQTMLSYRGLTLGALLSARRFQSLSPPADFSTELAALRASLMSHQDSEVRADILNLLDRFERGQPLVDK